MKLWNATHAPDRITAPALTPGEAAWRAAVQPADTAVANAEKRWGSLQRLMGYCDPDISARFGAAWHKFDDAITAGDIDTIAERSAIVMRGVAAMERSAAEKGHTFDPEVWHTVVDGKRYAVCLKAKETISAANLDSDAEVWSLDELIRTVKQIRGASFIEMVKKEFPGATVENVKPAFGWEKGDDISDLPF